MRRVSVLVPKKEMGFYTDVRDEVTRERHQAALLLDDLYRTVAPIVRIRDIRAVAPNVSQYFARVLIFCVAFPGGSVMGGRLYNVEVGKVWVSNTDALHDLRERGKRIRHPHPCKLRIEKPERKKGGGTRAFKHTLDRGPRAEPYAHPVRTDGVDDSIDDLKQEASAILYRTTVRIRPLVTVRLQKLVHEVPVRAMDLHAIEPGPEDGVPSCRSEQLHIFPDLFHRQRMWHGWRGRVGFVCGWNREWARRNDRVPAFFLKDIQGRGAPERRNLEEDERPVFVHRIYDLPRR